MQPRAKEATLVGQEAFRRLFDLSGDVMLLADDERRYVDVNPAACVFFGVERVELVGLRVDDLTPPEGRPHVAEAWSAFIAEGHAAGDHMLETPRGVRDVEFSAIANVVPGLHLSILRDVTERKLAEAGRQLFADVAAGIRLGLHVWELGESDDAGDLRLIYANPESETVSGVSPSAIVGSTLRDAFPRFTEVPMVTAVLAAASSGVATDLGDVAYGDDRVAQGVYSVSVFPLPGRRAGITFTDVSGVRRLESRLLDTLESMTDAFLTLDRDWNFTYLNPQSEPILRRLRSDLLGKNMWAEFPEAVGSVFDEQYHRALRDQVAVELEAYYEPLGKWLSLHVHPTPEGLAVHYQDVTKRRSLEAQLLQSQKLEAIGQLAGGVAHDFNNLLTVIDGYAALAEAKVDEPAFVTKALAQITDASGRAGALTAKLLAFSRKQMLQTTVADINEIVRSVLSLIAPTIGEQYTVHRLLDPNAGFVLADVHEIEQVILNLVVNARDAMSDTGNLYLSTRSVEVGSTEDLALAPSPYVALSVRDDGRGMNAETLAQVFDPFFTTKPVGRGTGLGLSTAFGTISQSGGHIAIVSAPGAGTTVTVYLPQTEQAVELPGPGPRARPSGGGERLLVVEDDEAVQNLTVEILESFGYHAARASNPNQALVICAGAKFDLMVTDVVMPGGNGSALARAAVARQPELRVLYTSGYTPDSLDDLLIEGAETAFLPKPFNANQLGETVRELLDR